MADAQVNTTVTRDSESSGAGASPGLALRWVCPDPARSPSWLTRPVLLGRDESCEVRLVSNQVSRRHASIERMGGLWLIRDLGSKNGVRVNGVQVTTHALAAGDVLRIGDVVAVIVEAVAGTDLSFRHFSSDLFGGHQHAQAFHALQAHARSPLSVVLEGATGTGKERFARMLHALSGRSGPFVAVNCSVYGPNIAAAELFGYKRGAFTGANEASTGHVRSAEHGTLLLDELTELPLDVQPMLLRVLENREVLALGEVEPRPIDVRFVAATQVSLSSAVAAGDFRADLRARLEGNVVRLPPLLECREILPEALLALLSRYTDDRPVLSPGFTEQLCAHDFSLNVRELDTLARRLARTVKRDTLTLDDWTSAQSPSRTEPPTVTSKSTIAPKLRVPGRETGAYSEAEVARLRDALVRCDGNVAKAAMELGLSRARAYRMLKSSAENGGLDQD